MTVGGGTDFSSEGFFIYSGSIRPSGGAVEIDGGREAGNYEEKNEEKKEPRCDSTEKSQRGKVLITQHNMGKKRCCKK